MLGEVRGGRGCGDCSLTLAFFVDGECGYGSDAREDVEEDSRRFCHAFTEPSRPSFFKVKLFLTDRFGSDDMSGEVLLDGFGRAQLEIVCVKLDGNISTGRKWKRLIALLTRCIWLSAILAGLKMSLL